MYLILPEEKKKITIRRFLDWDKHENTFYNNIYLENCKRVIKMVLIHTENSEKDIKIKKFDLVEYTYLCSY